MAEYMMLMKGSGAAEAWAAYISKLADSGKFRGGSELGNGQCHSKVNDNSDCAVTGFMRFEADSIDEIEALLPGNPVYESGGSVELLEIVIS